MADITTRYQGEVADGGKVNWRGDQVTVPQGGQSIYMTSSVELADLGSRVVVGDRVFRYALASGGAGAGDLCETKAEHLDSVTAGGTNASGCKTFTWYAATAMSANTYAEGYLMSQSGTAANLGQFYRIKSHPAIAKTTNGTLYLYDTIAIAEDVTDEWSINQNPYKSVIECTTGAASIPVGVAPVLVASSNYFWLQTWGPAMVKAGTAIAKGEAIIADVTGQVYNQKISSAGGQVFAVLGHGMMLATASQYAMVFLTIAP